MRKDLRDLIRHNKVVAVLDVDCDTYDQFDAIDKQYLEEIVDLLEF